MSARPTPNAFLNGSNYHKIVGFLRQHYAKKLNMQTVPEKMDGRIQKVVQHYMQEVSRIQAGKPIDILTREVLRESTTSIDTFLKKQETGMPSAVTTVGAFPPVGGDDYSRLYDDTNSNYERLMAERAPAPAPAPAVPDFRTASDMIEESTEDPVVLMQRLQKQREDQARAMGLSSIPVASNMAPAPPTNTVVGGAPRLEIHDEPVPSAANPVAPQAELPPRQLAPRPQDYIIPQQDVVKYIETEYNIFLTSSDRDWLRNTGENRYNFTVNFNTGSKKIGFGYNPAVQERFRNIQRIEFVKAIVPIESLTTLVKVTSASPSVVYDTTRVVNVFSLPFASVRIAELNNNGFSTKPEEDNTFAIVQYDTTWSSDLTAQAVQGTAPAAILTKSGYTGLIPKFLKTQKVYTPTPLATLQRMSIRLERHNGNLFSDDSDVWFLKRVAFSGALNAIGNVAPGVPVYNVSSANVEHSYIYLQTNSYFPFSAVAEGDNIQIQGFSLPVTSDAALDLTNYINRAEGHYVVATGYVNSASDIMDGRNTAGYCNLIIIRSRFNDPSTGSTTRSNAYYGGSLAAENTLATELTDPEAIPSLTGCGLINFSRQTHLVLRIITRDMDSGSNIRPDNV